jgi:hypothetical protein
MNEIKKFITISKILLILYSILNITIIILCIFKRIEINFTNAVNERQLIDCEIKELENCFITLHNFISLKNYENNSIKPEASVKTYIYSVSKPFLLEILNNATEDCLCCTNNQNEFIREN